MIVSFQQLKGGCGKSSLALHAAAALALEGARVLFLDCDPQGSALDWSANRAADPLFSVAGLPRPVIHKEIKTLIRGYDHVIIDTPPRAADIARSALLAADLVVLPVSPSPYDVWSLDEMIKLVHEAQIINERLKSVIAINRKIVNTAIGRDVTEALSGFDIPVLKSQIAQRVLFAESAASGSTVLEADPAGIAAGEIRAMVDEIKSIMEQKPNGKKDHHSGKA